VFRTITQSFDVRITRSCYRWDRDSENFTYKASVYLVFHISIIKSFIRFAYLIDSSNYLILWIFLINCLSLKDCVLCLSMALFCWVTSSDYGILCMLL